MASSFAMALGPTRRRDSRAADRDGDESERSWPSSDDDGDGPVTTQMRAGGFLIMLFRETDADLLGALANVSPADRIQNAGTGGGARKAQRYRATTGLRPPPLVFFVDTHCTQMHAAETGQLESDTVSVWLMQQRLVRL